MTAWPNALKILCSLLLLGGLLVVAVYLALVAAFSGNAGFIPVVLMTGALIYVLLNGLLFQQFRTKRRILIFGAVAVLTLIALGVMSIEPIRKAYHASIATMSAEVNVYAYQPFFPGAKLARLEQPASLQLQESLPNLDGATALYPLYAAFVEAVYPEDDYPNHKNPVRVLKTSGAYERLSNGEADMIFVAAPNEEQREQAGSDLQLTPIGKEAFVFFVNRKNPIDSLTVAQIQGIYAGEITNWKEVGGKDRPIKAFQRPRGSGSQSALERFMGDKPLQRAPEERVSIGMGHIIEEVADYRNYTNSIGYSFRFFSTEMVQNGAIKLIGVDGVTPTKDSIRSGAYPISETLYAVTAGSKNPNIQPFIDWILSEEGQALVEKTGYVSLGSE